MIIRMLRPEESWRSDLVMATAFEGNYNLEKAKEEIHSYRPTATIWEMERGKGKTEVGREKGAG